MAKIISMLQNIDNSVTRRATFRWCMSMDCLTPRRANKLILDCVLQTLEDKAKRKSQSTSIIGFECISGLQSRKDESAFCLEALVESVRHDAGQPASAILKEGDKDKQKVEAFLPYLQQTGENESFSLRGGSMLLPVLNSHSTVSVESAQICKVDSDKASQLP